MLAPKRIDAAAVRSYLEVASKLVGLAEREGESAASGEGRGANDVVSPSQPPQSAFDQARRRIEAVSKAAAGDTEGAIAAEKGADRGPAAQGQFLFQLARYRALVGDSTGALTLLDAMPRGHGMFTEFQDAPEPPPATTLPASAPAGATTGRSADSARLGVSPANRLLRQARLIGIVEALGNAAEAEALAAAIIRRAKAEPPFPGEPRRAVARVVEQVAGAWASGRNFDAARATVRAWVDPELADAIVARIDAYQRELAPGSRSFPYTDFEPIVPDNRLLSQLTGGAADVARRHWEAGDRAAYERVIEQIRADTRWGAGPVYQALGLASFQERLGDRPGARDSLARAVSAAEVRAAEWAARNPGPTTRPALRKSTVPADQDFRDIARLYVYQGDLPAARAVLARCSPSSQVEGLMDLAAQLKRDGDARAAIPILSEAARLCAVMDSPVYANRGLSEIATEQLALGDAAGARETARLMVEYALALPQWLRDAAAAERKAGSETGARALERLDLQLALKETPSALVSAADVYTRAGDNAAAIRTLGQAVKATEQWPADRFKEREVSGMLRAVAVRRVEAGDEAAVAEAKQYGAHQGLAELYTRTGRVADLEALFKEMPPGDDRDSAADASVAALKRAGRLEDALRVAEFAPPAARADVLLATARAK